MRQAATYSELRQYSLHNVRFNKSASALVRMTSEPGQGKRFTISESSGSSKLINVIETLLSSEAEAGRPGKVRDHHKIDSSNYRATVLGTETVSGLDCWVLALTARARSKYLVNGTAWVDKESFGLVRLDATTAASVSIWVGTPRIVEDFAPVAGIWLPLHLVSTSSSLLLGESDLEIRHMNYQIQSRRWPEASEKLSSGSAPILIESGWQTFRRENRRETKLPHPG